MADLISKLVGLLGLLVDLPSSEKKAGAVRVLDILCFDVRELVAAGTPAFVKELIGRLGSSSLGVQEQTLRTLRILAESDRFRVELGEVNGCLEGVVALLGSSSLELQQGAARALKELTKGFRNAKAVGCIPGCFQKLVGLLGSTSLEVQEHALDVLLTWTDAYGQQVENAKSLVHVSGFLENLVRLLWISSPGVLRQAVAVLKLLALDCENGKKIAQVSGCLDQLGELLESTSSEVQSEVTTVLRRLARVHENLAKMIKVPGCLERFMSIFGSESLGGASWNQGQLEVAAVEALRNLAKDAENKTVCLKTLVGLLGCQGSTRLQAEAARLLGELAAKDEEYKEIIAQVPGCLEGLANLLGANGSAPNLPGRSHYKDVERCAADTLTTLSASPANRKTIARMPCCLKKIVGLLERVVYRELDFCAASMLRYLAEDAELKEKIARVPGCLTGLVGLLSPPRWSETRTKVQAAGALLILATGSAEIKKEIACVPGCLEVLNRLRASSTADADVQKAVAGLLRTLAGDAESV
jgi:hypothetical protein